MASLVADRPARAGAAIRVGVADRRPLYREALVRWLRHSDGIALVAQAADGATALADLRTIQADVALVDHDLPGVGGPGLAAIVRREGLRTRVIILADTANGGDAFRALSSGAAAYLTKDAEAVELRSALDTVAAGHVVLPPAVLTHVAREIRLRHRSDRPALTVRERQVLVLVAGDHTTAEIGTHLHLSAATVQTHVRHVNEKLRVSDRAAAVATAIRLGLLE